MKKAVLIIFIFRFEFVYNSEPRSRTDIKSILTVLRNVRSPIIITKNDDNLDDKYFTDMKYKSIDPTRDTSYSTDTLNSFVIPYLLGFNSNNRNLTTQQLASQVFLLAYGILLKAIDNRLYENNKVFVENYIKPSEAHYEEKMEENKYDPYFNNYIKSLETEKGNEHTPWKLYPRSDYEITNFTDFNLFSSSPQSFSKTFMKLNRNKVNDDNSIHIILKTNT